MKAPSIMPTLGRSLRVLLTLTLCLAGVAGSQAVWSQAVPSQAAATLPESPTASSLPPSPVLSSPVLSRVPGPGLRSQQLRSQRLRALTHPAASPSSFPAPEPALATANYKFVNITIPHATAIQVGGIDNSGRVVGNFDSPGQETSHGFLWSSGTAQTIDYPGAVYTFFTGINNRGVLVADVYTSETASEIVATYSLATSTWTVLPNLPADWQPNPQDPGISDEGLVVGCAERTGIPGNLSWVWHPDTQTYSYFTVPAASEATTCASATSYNGDIVGSYQPAYSASVVIFLKTSQDQYESIDPPAPQTYIDSPSAINDSDTIAGILQTSTTISGFVRTGAGVFTLVKQPGFANSVIMGINDSGVLCGNSFTHTGAAVAFIAYPE